jgi:hypothetical protein
VELGPAAVEAGDDRPDLVESLCASRSRVTGIRSTQCSSNVSNTPQWPDDNQPRPYQDDHSSGGGETHRDENCPRNRVVLESGDADLLVTEDHPPQACG